MAIARFDGAEDVFAGRGEGFIVSTRVMIPAIGR
jgi:hypothetical protein